MAAQGAGHLEDLPAAQWLEVLRIEVFYRLQRLLRSGGTATRSGRFLGFLAALARAPAPPSR